MISQIQINLINGISGTLYGYIYIEPSEYPILTIDLLKKQVRKFVEYDICIFLYNLSIIQTSDDLYHLVIQNSININVIYDNIKKSQRLERINADFMRYKQRMYEYAEREYYMISNMTIYEMEEHYKKIHYSAAETLLFDTDGTTLDLIISIHLSSKRKKISRSINTDLINLNSILYLSFEDIEHYDRHSLSKDDFREYYGKI